MKKPILTFLSIFCFAQIARTQFYDGSNVQFGKNRVQYDDFEWQYFRFSTFETYFYTGGKELAIHASKSAATYIREMESFLDYYGHDKIKFIIYNKYDHYKQSNIGIVDEYSNLGGVNKVIGSKVFIYFEGDHSKFEMDLKAGTAEVMLGSFLYGGDWRSIFRNSDMYRMPDWYFTGLVSFLSEGWNSEINDITKDAILSGRYKRIGRLEGENAKYAGHAIWKYIADTYGESVIPNILYVSKVNRDVESGFMYVLGITLKDLLKEWHAYSYDLYKKDVLDVEMPKEVIMKKKTRKNRVYYSLKMDPAGRYITYATNKKGKSKLFLYDTELGRRKKIFKHGIKLDRPPHYLYPRVAWHPAGEILAYVYQKRGEVFLSFYQMDNGKTTTRRIFLMEDILDISYARDGRQMVFSGVYEGQSDIYLYNVPGNTQKKITDDRFDDLSPVFSDDSKEIIFTSNRITDEVRPENDAVDTANLNTDLFAYRIGRENKFFHRITSTGDVSEKNPVAYRNGDIYYLSDENGSRNVFKTSSDSVITSIDTSIHYRHYYTKEEKSMFKRNIIEFTTTGTEGEEAFLYFQDRRYHIKGGHLMLDSSESQESEVPDSGTHENVLDLGASHMYRELEVIYDDGGPPGEVDIRNYRFDDKESISLLYEKEVIVFDRDEVTDREGKDYFVLPQQRNYNLSFFKDQSVLQINNSFLNQQYQKYNPPYQNPGLGAMLILGISDLFEDHKIFGGIRLGSENHEYMISYQNLKHRLDKEYYAGLVNYNTETGSILYKNRSMRAAVLTKYPFTEVSSFHFAVLGRRDKAIPQARDSRGLVEPIVEDYWVTAKLAYVYDNTRDKAINIKFGTRYKLFAEHYKQLTNEEVSMEVVGLDIRHYQRIHRELIFFARLAGGTSFGKGKLVYYLGGIDNWMATNRFNFNKTIDAAGQNYQFQALATNMRGFRQNIRNGNTFGVVNTELRWPIVKYFISRPIRSPFLSNFQIIGFGDVGTAWTGTNPLSEDNDQLSEPIDLNSIKIVLKKLNDPIVGGYGFGLRSSILGYFVRLDWAWGVENGIVQDRMFYFSLSLDL